MPFVDVKLAEVEATKPDFTIPVGTYKFKLQPGAEVRINRFRTDYSGQPLEQLNVRFDVAEGEFAGRVAFATYDDPTALSKKSGEPNAWSAQALKRLEIALGEDSLPGETPEVYLNRVASNGNTFITAAMVDNSYTMKGTDTIVNKTKFGIFTVNAAA
jgi:hypothetical protein